MQYENPVKVAPRVAASGTPTVVPPPVWMGRVPVAMNTNQQQTMAYVMNLAGPFPNDNGYPAMPNQYAQQSPQNPQNLENLVRLMQPPPTHQNPDAHQNQSNEANS